MEPGPLGNHTLVKMGGNSGVLEVPIIQSLEGAGVGVGAVEEVGEKEGEEVGEEGEVVIRTVEVNDAILLVPNLLRIQILAGARDLLTERRRRCTSSITSETNQMMLSQS
jgi:hypothetical protein